MPDSPTGTYNDGSAKGATAWKSARRAQRSDGGLEETYTFSAAHLSASGTTEYERSGTAASADKTNGARRKLMVSGERITRIQSKRFIQIVDWNCGTRLPGEERQDDLDEQGEVAAP